MNINKLNFIFFLLFSKISSGYDINIIKYFNFPSEYIENPTKSFSLIKLKSAWGKTIGKNVKIGIIEDGEYYFYHSDLITQWATDCSNHMPTFASRHNCKVSLNSGHATQISGIIAAAGNNALSHSKSNSAVGVAWGAKLVPITLGNLKDVTSDQLIAAFDFLHDQNVRVVNISIKFSFKDAELQNLIHAFTYATKELGLLLITSPGNISRLPRDSSFWPVPALLDEHTIDRNSIIRVGRLKDTGCPTGILDNAAIDIVAPHFAYTTLANGDAGLIPKLGSSFSIPYVTGAIALALECSGGATNKKLKETLIRTSSQIEGDCKTDDTHGLGILNVDKFIKEICTD